MSLPSFMSMCKDEIQLHEVICYLNANGFRTLLFLKCWESTISIKLILWLDYLIYVTFVAAVFFSRVWIVLFYLSIYVMLAHKRHESSKDLSPDPCCYGVAGSPRVGLVVNISGLLYMFRCRRQPVHCFFFTAWNNLQMHRHVESNPVHIITSS